MEALTPVLFESLWTTSNLAAAYSRLLRAISEVSPEWNDREIQFGKMPFLSEVV